MVTLKLTSDKYGRKLATIYIGSETPAEVDDSEYYMAILLVNVNENNAMENLKSVASTLSEEKVFTIAIFITDRYDWSFDNSLLFGINAWMTATTSDEAKNIAADIQDIIASNTPIALDLADLKSILYKSEGRRFYFGTGTSSGTNLKAAIENAVEKAKESGMDVYECSKYLIAFSYNKGLMQGKMTDLNNFIDDLSSMHEGNSEFKWGLLQPKGEDTDDLKFILLASH